jgi:hypothetical protein
MGEHIDVCIVVQPHTTEDEFNNLNQMLNAAEVEHSVCYLKTHRFNNPDQNFQYAGDIVGRMCSIEDFPDPDWDRLSFFSDAGAMIQHFALEMSGSSEEQVQEYGSLLRESGILETLESVHFGFYHYQVISQ